MMFCLEEEITLCNDWVKIKTLTSIVISLSFLVLISFKKPQKL